MKLKVSKENQKGLNTEFVNVETGRHISLEHAVTQINKGIFYYKASDIGGYKEYDFSSEKECESSINDSESRIYRREENDFWKLLYFRNDGKYLPARKMKAEELELFQKRIPRQTFGYHEYYFAIKNPIAEIVIKDYFAQDAEVKLLEPMFSEDFSHNYRIRIANDKMEHSC